MEDEEFRIWKLNEFEISADLDTFIEIFGERLGNHLWVKFSETYNNSVVRLWASLGSEQRPKLLEALNKIHV